MKLVSVQFSHQRCVMQKEPEKGFDGSGHWNKIIRSQTHARIFHGPGRPVWLMQDHNIQNISRADWQHFSCKYFREWDSSTTLPAENRILHLCHPQPSTDNNRHQVQSPSSDIHWKWYRKLKSSKLHAWRSNTARSAQPEPPGLVLEVGGLQLCRQPCLESWTWNFEVWGTSAFQALQAL